MIDQFLVFKNGAQYPIHRKILWMCIKMELKVWFSTMVNFKAFLSYRILSVSEMPQRNKTEIKQRYYSQKP